MPHEPAHPGRLHRREVAPDRPRVAPPGRSPPAPSAAPSSSRRRPPWAAFVVPGTVVGRPRRRGRPSPTGSAPPCCERADLQMTDPRETYVLDTCVLLADPHALHRFDEHDVVLPLVVIEELDRKKTAMDDVGRNARHALRHDRGGLRVEHGGGLRDAVPLPGGGTLRIESNHVDVALPPYLDPTQGRPPHPRGLDRAARDAGHQGHGAADQGRPARRRGRGLPRRHHPVSEHYEGVRELDVEPHVRRRAAPGRQGPGSTPAAAELGGRRRSSSTSAW